MTMGTASAPSWGVFGHEWAVEHLRRGIANGRTRHAYLIIGAESVGKATLARAFASALLCSDPDPTHRPCGVCSACRRVVSGNHADVLTALDEDGVPVKIEALRGFMSQIALKPFEGGYRFGIIPRFDEVRPQVQDALLKTLEEPPPRAILILLARAREQVLPTILSRAQKIALRPASIEAVRAALLAQPGAQGADAAHIDLLAHISGGRVGWAIRALSDPDMLAQRAQAIDLLLEMIGGTRKQRFDLANDLAGEVTRSRTKENLATLLALWQSFWRDALLLSHGAEEGIANRDRLDALHQVSGGVMPDMLLEAMRATNTMLERLPTNVNVRLALEGMLLAYPR